MAGYLNLAADAAHNFTDGLMLGANFLSGPRQGLSATLAILFHEVPHEVGDVAILMQAGFSKWAAIRAQLSTALGALLGTLVGLAAGRTNSALLQCFTAGGFIYVATVDVLPSLLRECSPKQSALELLAMGAGIYLMYLVRPWRYDVASSSGGRARAGIAPFYIQPYICRIPSRSTQPRRSRVVMGAAGDAPNQSAESIAKARLAHAPRGSVAGAHARDAATEVPAARNQSRAPSTP